MGIDSIHSRILPVNALTPFAPAVGVSRILADGPAAKALQPDFSAAHEFYYNSDFFLQLLLPFQMNFLTVDVHV